MSEPVLRIENLKTSFMTSKGEVPAVDGVDLALYPGEVVGLVGESGCGKSMTSLSVLRLVPSPPGKIVEGAIYLKGRDLVPLKEKEMCRIRGKTISMIFQEPMTSLNPLFTIGQQMMETLRLHERISRKEAMSKAVSLLADVGISRPDKVISQYPHELSGGMRQRVMIAMAISCNPEVLIADEPTTALDVTIQAQILDLIRARNKKHGTAVLMITHDLGVVAEMCNRVAVMYAGKVVEQGSVRDIFSRPQHPYTQGLIRSVPRLADSRDRLYSIPGQVPVMSNKMKGCRFSSRCPHVMEICTEQLPELVERSTGHSSRCWLEELPQEDAI
ncbi:ABC transporter ATP-binding protein [Paenibacillus provencensis]|uniref:ABC transporter ATP-binding protein n=1 Tax=Paenibacillus provencensis TaxID=441151 RepID=A0ABW3PW20_9BACL|nr:ABC transporter ATP-binding protein [Paenibacillus sp. MER 78]MCM3127746.1 ABC transporter ATP-binding protein [Paenibacillus sp. MER 78]